VPKLAKLPLLKAREPRKCGKCNKINPPDGWFCNRCATSLLPEALGAVEREEQEARRFFVELYRNKEFRKWLESKFREAEAKILGPEG
jgi:hypothetical protein